MPSINTLVFALTPAESSEFLPQPMFSQAKTLAARTETIDPTTVTRDQFQATLAALNPDVLVGCWRTHPLSYPVPSNLRYVCYLAGSIRKLVERRHLEEGLVVTNWSDSISRVVAEATLAHILNSLRNAGHWIPAMHRDGAWKDATTQTRSLFQRRVGIHGFGRVARELTRLLAPFDVEISIYAPEKDPALYAAHRAKMATSLEDLFSKNDIVVELSPLIPSTRGIVTEALLRLIPKGGVFINTGRGQLVDPRAVERIALEGRIQLGLDVYEVEPLPASSPLRGLPNVVLTPHLGGPTNDRRRDAGEFALQNLLAYSAGAALKGVITPEVFDTHSM